MLTFFWKVPFSWIFLFFSIDDIVYFKLMEYRFNLCMHSYFLSLSVSLSLSLSLTHTHTHTHIYMYIKFYPKVWQIWTDYCFSVKLPNICFEITPPVKKTLIIYQFFSFFEEVISYFLSSPNFWIAPRIYNSSFCRGMKYNQKVSRRKFKWAIYKIKWWCLYLKTAV